MAGRKTQNACMILLIVIIGMSFLLSVWTFMKVKNFNMSDILEFNNSENYHHEGGDRKRRKDCDCGEGGEGGEGGCDCDEVVEEVVEEEIMTTPPSSNSEEIMTNSPSSNSEEIVEQIKNIMNSANVSGDNDDNADVIENYYSNVDADSTTIFPRGNYSLTGIRVGRIPAGDQLLKYRSVLDSEIEKGVRVEMTQPNIPDCVLAQRKGISVYDDSGKVVSTNEGNTIGQRAISQSASDRSRSNRSGGLLGLVNNKLNTRF